VSGPVAVDKSGGGPFYDGERIFPMHDSVIAQRDHILETLLPDVAFTGWRWGAVEEAAVKAGLAAEMAAAVFPGGLADVVAHFSDWADRAMLRELAALGPETMRVRDRVAAGVMTRLEILQDYREAVRAALSYWAMPLRGPRAGGVVWRTADRIWDWAGDTATDYNRYTKRTLLCGVIGSTTLAWLGDDTADLAQTREFLDRRIENVMQMGKFIGKIKGRMPGRRGRQD
jgi:ubiquinone biosynthesis protein COQ9